MNLALWVRQTKAQIKHIKNVGIKNFGPPKTPPPKKKKCLCLGFFLYFEGKGAPKHKEFTGSGVPFRGGGSRRGISGQNSLCLCPLFRACWEKLNRGFPNRGVSHFFSGKVQIVSRTLSGLFLVGAPKRPRKRKRDESGKSPDHPRADRENPGKNRESPKKDQKGKDKSRSGNPPV